MKTTYLNRVCPRNCRAFLLTFCVGTSCLLGLPTVADELRFGASENGKVAFPGDTLDSERVDLLNNALDHRQRKLAEEKLEDDFAPVYTAQRGSATRFDGASERIEDARLQPRRLDQQRRPAAQISSQPSELDASLFTPVQTRAVKSAPAYTYASPAYTSSAETLEPRNAVDGPIFNSSAYSATRSDEPARGKLAVDDVREFSQLTEAQDDIADSAFLEELSEDVAAEERLDAATFADIADECFYALDPYSSLFIAYEPTADWTESCLQYVEDILNALESPDARTLALLDEFDAKIADGAALKQALERADKLDPVDLNVAEPGKAPVLAERYNLQQRQDMLDAFCAALKRRAFLWRAATPYFQARAEGALAQPVDLTTPQLVKALRETGEVRAFFGDAPNGRSWRASFDVDLLADDIAAVLELQVETFEPTDSARLASRYASAQIVDDDALTPAELAAMGKPLTKRELLLKERARRMRFLRDRLNSVAYKLEKTPMTPEQRQVFKRPTLASWTQLARDYSCDQANGVALLYEFERYENLGGGQAGRALQQLALRASTSKSECCRAFGRAIDSVYDNPNVKAYVSEALINRLLPIRDPEFGVVQERILNNPVAGNRRVDTTVAIDLVPDPNRLLMNLVINGRVSSTTSSEVFASKLHNESYATYVGRKALEWRDTGVAYSPATVTANSSNRLSAVETEIDFVPLVGDVARGMVRAQYESRQGEIQAQLRARVSSEARQRIDLEANERFNALNEQLRNGFFARLNKLDLSLKTQRSRTTADWLLASLRLGSDYSLGCQNAEPPTLDGAFADVKLHESALNAYLAQLELGGRESDPRETIEYLAEKLDRPALREIELEDNDLHYTFAKSDPVVVRFFEDRICLRLSFAKMRLGAQEWEDLEVVVNYRPSIGPDGQPTFTRDGVVELYGPTNIKTLLPLRAIFAKVFAAQRQFDLKPEMLAEDDRFYGLQLGLLRVKPGWLAVSVVRDDAAYDAVQ